MKFFKAFYRLVETAGESLAELRGINHKLSHLILEKRKRLEFVVGPVTNKKQKDQ